MPTGAQAVASLLASLGAAWVSWKLGLRATHGGLVAACVLAWVLQASRTTFLAIRFKKTMPPHARLGFFFATITEYIYRLTHRQQVKHQKHRRFLSGFEATVEATHRISKSFMVGNIITFDHPLSLSEVKKATEQLQQRHSILRAVIVPGPWWPSFDVSKESRPIDVQELSCSAEEAVSLFFQEGLHSSGPMRIGLCGPDMVLSYHHGFLDGGSIMTLLEELLAMLHGPVPEVEDVGLAQPPGDSLPWYYPLWLVLGWTDRAQSWRAQPVVPPMFKASRWQEQRAKLLRRELDVRQAAALREACRANGTTVAGALGAAMLRAVAPLSEPGALHICRTFVNLRPHSGQPPEVMGAFVGWVDAVLEVGGAFWERARAWKAEVIALMAERRHLWAAIWPMLFTPFSEYVKIFAAEFVRAKEPEGCVGIGLSNRGSFKLETPSHRVKSVHFVRNQLGVGKDVFQLNACTVNGTLCLTLGYYSPGCSYETAQAVLGRVIVDLEGAAEGSVPADGGSS